MDKPANAVEFERLIREAQLEAATAKESIHLAVQAVLEQSEIEGVAWDIQAAIDFVYGDDLLVVLKSGHGLFAEGEHLVWRKVDMDKFRRLLTNEEWN